MIDDWQKPNHERLKRITETYVHHQELRSKDYREPGVAEETITTALQLAHDCGFLLCYIGELKCYQVWQEVTQEDVNGHD
jgi:hypothetical protein